MKRRGREVQEVMLGRVVERNSPAQLSGTIAHRVMGMAAENEARLREKMSEGESEPTSIPMASGGGDSGEKKEKKPDDLMKSLASMFNAEGPVRVPTSDIMGM